MSTCQGAPAPHDDCPAGDRCDWRDPAELHGPAREFVDDALATLFGGVADLATKPEPVYVVPNRVDRRRAARQRRFDRRAEERKYRDR